MSGRSSHLSHQYKPIQHEMTNNSSADGDPKYDDRNDNSMTAAASNDEVEKLRRRLLDRELTIAQLQSRMTELSNASVAPGHMRAAMRANTDHWQDSYHRLSEAHRRLQRVNQGLEDKLLKLADRSQGEKEALTEHTTSLTTALTTAAAAMHRLKGEKERLQQDLNIAIQLLQCNSSNYNSHRIDSLPSDLQQRVRTRLDAESQQRFSSVTAPPTPKTTEMKIIRVPIPTFPPTAMVYSLNKCSEDGPDEGEVQEAEDRVSAAIMAAVLEERQKEQRHCPTCSCVNGSGTNNSAASGGNRPGTGGREGAGGDGGGRGNSFHGSSNHSSSIGSNGNMSFFTSSMGNVKFVRDRVNDSAPANTFHRSPVTEGSSDRKSVGTIEDGLCNIRTSNGSNSNPNRGTNSTHNNVSNYAILPLSDTSPLIDLHSDYDTISITERKQGEKTKKLVEINTLDITEHFNSENLGELTVNNCICGRPYSFGTNVIDVGTQTVPSYIGESGKVHSTCIYCKGQKIRDKHKEKHKDSKGQHASGVRQTSVSSSSDNTCRTACNNNCNRSNCINNCHASPRSSNDTIDGECLSLMSSSDVSYCSSSSEGNPANTTSSSNCKREGVSPPLHKHHKGDSVTPQSSPTSMDLSEHVGVVSELSTSPTRAGGSSSCSWDWPSHSSALGGPDGGGRDSGSPSTPSSFTSRLSGAVSAATSYNEGDISCEPSPHLSPRRTDSQQRIQHRRPASLAQAMPATPSSQQCDAEITSMIEAVNAPRLHDAGVVLAAATGENGVLSTSDASTQCSVVPLVNMTVQTNMNTVPTELSSLLSNAKQRQKNSDPTSSDTNLTRDLIQFNSNSASSKIASQTSESYIGSSTADASVHLPLDTARNTRQMSDSGDSFTNPSTSTRNFTCSEKASRRVPTNGSPDARNRSGGSHGSFLQRSIRKPYCSDMDESLSLEVSADLLARLTSTIDSFDLKVQELNIDSKSLEELRSPDSFYTNDVVNQNVSGTLLISNAPSLRSESMSFPGKGNDPNRNMNTYFQESLSKNEVRDCNSLKKCSSSSAEQQQFLNARANAVLDGNEHLSLVPGDISNRHINKNPISYNNNNSMGYQLGSSNNINCNPLVTSMQSHTPEPFQRRASLNTPPIHRVSTAKCSQASLFSQQRQGCGSASTVLEGGGIVVASTATASATVTSL